MRTKKNYGLILIALIVFLTNINAQAVNLWVGQSYTWDFSGSVLGSTYNMSVTSNGGYLSITGSGFYRTIKPTQFFNGTATITAEWDYTLYYGDSMKHQKVTLSVSCNENPVSISPTSITLSPGEKYYLSYSHKYNNDYVGAANVYFSGGNSSFTVSADGLITAIAPGSGYVNVFSKLSSASNAPYCTVTVKEVEPTGASVSNFSILADQSKDLTVNISPSNASVKSRQWYVKSGEDVVSISGQRLTGLKAGTATIYCMVNGSVRSNDAVVTVTEPKLNCASTLPSDGVEDISVFVNPGVTYSHAITEDDGFNAIILSVNGQSVEGTVELSGNTVRFLPAKPLSPKTKYELFIPKNAVKNKWGTNAQEDVKLSFTTGALEKATVSFSPVSGSFLTSEDAVKLTPVPSNAIIYYTTDGSEPTVNSSVYNTPIKANEDFILKAFAVSEGYEDSEIVVAEYYKSESEIISYFPNDNEPLFTYGLVSPYLKLSGEVEKSNNFRRISLTDGDGNVVEGEPFITNYLVVFVPQKPLSNSTSYTMDIPRDALKTKNGEVFKGFTWTFTTPTMTTDIAMRGDETVYLLDEKGVVKARGMAYKSLYNENGSFTFEDWGSLENYNTGLTGEIREIDGGYTHAQFRTGSTFTRKGFVMCGEGGSSSSNELIGGIKSIKAGFQTSAIISVDNSLWMSGRNDFYQLGDGSGTTSKEFIKVADNVIDVALGNGFTLFVDTDNTLWGVGRNNCGQLGDGTLENRKTPVKVMEDVAKVFASKSGFFSACITTDNRLYTWGDNEKGQLGRSTEKCSATPGEVLPNVIDASLGEAHSLAICENNKLYAWGSNEHGQVSQSGTSISEPTVMAENVMAVDAGSHTSLILSNSGRVSGWGKLTHYNFGEGVGKASDMMIYEGLPYSALKGVKSEPSYYEATPDSRFALIFKPIPNSADYDMIEWSTDNPDVASVDDHGVVTTGSKGVASISVKLVDRFGNFETAESVVKCTDNPDNSLITNTDKICDDWFAYSVGTTIVIENPTIEELYTIYDTQGISISSVKADSSRITIEAPCPGVYMVRSSEKVVKIICR